MKEKWQKLKKWFVDNKVVTILMASLLGGTLIYIFVTIYRKKYMTMNAEQWTPDSDTFAEIRNFEGFESQAYYDQETPNSPNRYEGGQGKLTIGYGHTGTVDGQPITEGMTIDKTKAEQLLQDDAAMAVSEVKSLITGEHTKPQFDSIFDFLFNTGQTGSDIIGMINGSTSPANIAIWFRDHYITENGTEEPGLVKRAYWRAKQWDSSIQPRP